jgi:hypothetical protein
VHGRNYLLPAPKLREGEPEWEVEAILATWRQMQTPVLNQMEQLSQVEQFMRIGGECGCSKSSSTIL